MAQETKYPTLELLAGDENAMSKFQTWLTNTLHRQVATVVFLKKDGTERTMQCTLSEAIVPPRQVKPALTLEESTEPKPERKRSNDVRTVYDVESKTWKSFRWDSIKSVTYEE